MTGIGTSGYNDLIRQALAAGRDNAKKQNSEDVSAVGSFGSVIRNIQLDSSTLERMESKRSNNDRWTRGDLYTVDTDSLRGYTVNKDALDKVREKLKEEGIDADSRTPTHEITDEQMEWLGSKYDLEFLSVCSFTHSEYGNFMLDLAYLNVFSLDEVENMYGVMPFNANNKAILYYHGDPKTGDGAGYIDPFGSVGSVTEDWDDTYTRLIMEYLKAKETNRTESEYKQMAEEFKAQRIERMMVIEEFFARFAENKESFIPDVSKPAIEDATEKLKEDFGSKNNGAFASSVSKQVENNFDFTDMYVRTHQTTVEEAVKGTYAASRSWANEKYLQVPVAGDLKELMESIEKALADGETLKSVLQNRIDKYAKECGIDGVVAVGGSHADLLLIDPDTGEVVDSQPKVRCLVWSKAVQDLDYSTVKSQADDLATFLRYTVFKKETDAPEKVSALISELKAKQSDYDTSRFLPIFSSVGDQGIKNAKYLRDLLGLDSINWDNLSDNERDEITDELMRILEEHYSSNSSKDDDLLDEMDKMKSASVGTAKIEKRVLTGL